MTTPREDVATECPSCRESIQTQATRCPHCAAEVRFCENCNCRVEVSVRQKFVGLLRGGTKIQTRCMQCNRVVDGPRF